MEFHVVTGAHELYNAGYLTTKHLLEELNKDLIRKTKKNITETTTIKIGNYFSPEVEMSVILAEFKYLQPFTMVSNDLEEIRHYGAMELGKLVDNIRTLKRKYENLDVFVLLIYDGLRVELKVTDYKVY